jgi:hypothetical protein
MVDQLVSGHAYEPRDAHVRHAALSARIDGRHECLGRQIFRHGGAATAWQEIAVYLGQRPSVDGDHGIEPKGLFKGAHTTSSF